MQGQIISGTVEFRQRGALGIWHAGENLRDPPSEWHMIDTRECSSGLLLNASFSGDLEV